MLETDHHWTQLLFLAAVIVVVIGFVGRWCKRTLDELFPPDDDDKHHFFDHH